jgi:hypothetical protein
MIIGKNQLLSVQKILYVTGADYDQGTLIFWANRVLSRSQSGIGYAPIAAAAI